MKILRQLYRLLTPAERRQALLLLPLLGLGALVEVAGIASILPFLALVVDPAAVDSRPVVRWLYEAGGFDDTRAFLLALGVLTFCLVVGSNVLTGFNTWAILRFSWLRNHTLGLRLLRSYLARPYPFFLERHSADLAKNLLAEVRQVVGGVLVRAVQMGARGVAALGILALLLVIDPLLAVLVPAILGGAYGLVYLAVRRRQRRMGESRFQANARRYQVLSEAFGGIKELKLLARERHVVERFRPPSLEHATTTAANFAMFQIPHFALEAIAFGGMLLIVLYLLARGHEATAILPTLGLYAFAGYRLMPSLKEVFNGLVDLRFNAAALENLLADLPRRDVTLPDAARIGPPLPLRESIRCRDLGFRYPTAARPLFRGLNLEIAAGGSVAFVGATGCGKSTLGDLLLGMLRPDAGVIEVDGVALDESNLARWRKNLGYVPQSIFLADESVTRNIAFGLPDSEIDPRAVERAARAAHLHDFVRDELPDGYDTVVGERGVRLSGGQRQRIGIARALYHDPQVILFDEATSSLDRPTEEVVLEAVAELTRERTVIMIAHRLSTVRLCERIFLLADGEIVAVGGYEELLASHPGFRALVAGSGVAGNEVTGNEVAGVEAG